MKVAFDAKRVTRNATGLGNYSRFVVNALADLYPEDQYLLFSPRQPHEVLRPKLPVQPNVHYFFPDEQKSKISQMLWRFSGIVGDLKLHKPDLYHGLSNELPLGIEKSGIPSVVTIHDLIFLHYPQYYKLIDRTIYRYKFRSACLSADRIIAVSEATKQDIVRAYHVPEEKIAVVYQGCDESFWQTREPEKLNALRQKYQLPSAYVLSVGTVEPRKNLLLTVKALKESGLDIPLLVIGKQTAYAGEVKAYLAENRMEQQVRFLRLDDFNELPALYQMASLFVYPSLMEGFGIPILEALCSGTPVIAATGTCLEEAGGPGSVYVNPNDPAELADKMKWVLHSPSVAEQMKADGKIYAERFKAPVVANQLKTVYQSIL